MSKILYIFLLFLCSMILSAQDIRFSSLTIEDGLSQNAVFSMIQDSRGLMWFGTKDGLNSYDGYTFKIYYHDPSDSNSISGNHITSITEDSRGFIWTGTLKEGLNCLDPVREKFYHISLRRKNGNIESSYEITAIDEDAYGNLWAGTWGDGLYRISPLDKDNKIYPDTVHFQQPEHIKGLENRQISAIHFDSEEILWLGSDAGLFRYDPEQFNLSHQNILTENPLDENNPFSNEVFSVYEGREGNLWLGTAAGLVRYDKYNGEYTVFPHKFNKRQYGWGKITDIVEDNSGLFWLASPGGLMRYDPSTTGYEYFSNDPDNPESISFNTITSLSIDKTGILWIGTAGMGINMYIPAGNQFSMLRRKPDSSSRITGFSIESILEDMQGRIWVSSGVLYCWDRKSNKLKSYETSLDEPDQFGNTSAWSMILADDKHIWTATPQGLYRFNPSTGEYTLYRFNPDDPDGLPQREVNCVYQDQKGTIWILTEKFLCKLVDIRRGKFRHYRFVNDPSDKKQSRAVIYEDSNASLWLGTKSGLYRFDMQTERFEVYQHDPADRTSLNNNMIKCFYPDPHSPDKYLWIGTDGGGLNRFEYGKKEFVHYTTSDGLPNNVVYGILPDRKGNLWISTNKGLSRFNPLSGDIRNFDSKDGLQSNEFNTGAYFSNSKGEMFFGGINGLNYFFPDDIRTNPYKPGILITRITVHDWENADSSPIEISNVNPSAEPLVLTHEKSNISFEFAALDYSAPEKNKYAYKLDNYDEDWIYSGSSRNVIYTHLPPGEYEFRVKASNNHGLWNETGTSVKLYISPPWWRSGWAYLFYISISLLILYLIRRYEIGRIGLKNQLKVEKVEIDTLRNLDQLKSNFFANISHEFRTPLTLILGQLDNVLSSHIPDGDKKKLKMADKNARSLLILINQLLDLSKIEGGAMDLDTTSCNIVSFLKNILYSFESLANDRNITLLFESSEERIDVTIDKEKMEKVFYNLISNSFKFTEVDGSIKVSVKRIQNAKIKVTVEDSGIGIPADRLSKVFDRFYQVDSSNRREFGGTGIGLALARELVEMHKGKIGVESEEGKGTRFMIELYVDIHSVVPLPNKEFPAEQSGELIINEKKSVDTASGIFPSAAKQSVGKEIILVTEDNDDVREYIHETLEKDYQVIEAKDGEEGVRIAREKLPDLIITDVMMPRKDGYQLCKEIREDEKTAHIPIIMLTAKAGMENKIQGLETGIDDFLTKPFNNKELKAIIKNLISQRKELRKRFSGSTIIKPSEVTSVSIDQVFLEKTLKIIEDHFIDEDFSVEILAGKVNMSVSQLNRKLNAMIDQPAGQLIRSLKLQRAADLLTQNSGTISEICYKLGFSDQAYFSRVFKKQFGSTPNDFRKKNAKIQTRN